VDYGQSREIEKRPAIYREYNPLVRKYGVNRYFAVASVSHLAVSYSLPNRYLGLWNGVSIASEAFIVGRNAKLGIRMSWR
jgi:hypothetical protein